MVKLAMKPFKISSLCCLLAVCWVFVDAVNIAHLQLCFSLLIGTIKKIECIESN